MEEKPKNHIHIKIGSLIIVLLIVFVLFRVNIEKAINSPMFQNNVNYIEKEFNIIYKNYLQKPFLYIWNNLFTDLLHTSLKNIDISDPLIRQDKINSVIKPDRINNYFGNTQEETVQQLSTPVNQN